MENHYSLTAAWGSWERSWAGRLRELLIFLVSIHAPPGSGHLLDSRADLGKFKNWNRGYLVVIDC